MRKRTPLSENTSYNPIDDNGRGLLQATEEQSQGNSQSQPAEPAALAKPQQERVNTLEAASAAIRFRYRGMERTDELALSPHTIEQLALEAAMRGVAIGELIADLITTIVSKDLFVLALDNTDHTTD